MRRSLHKYYDERRWAEAFLDGELLFRPLSYFRDYEDENVRGDPNEGSSIFRPQDGLVINNLTQGTTITLPRYSFESTAKLEEIFVFCLSNSQSDERREKFGAVACVEVLKIKALCERIEAVLPSGATFRGQRVEYYQETENCTPRWALPDKIAISKLAVYAWQDEYRLLFSLMGGLNFENVDLRLIHDDAGEPAHRREHHMQILKVGSLRDICRLHEF